MRRSIYNEPKNCFFLLFHMNYGVLCRRTFFVPKKESRSRKLNEDEQVIGFLEFCNLFTFKNTILASAISMNYTLCTRNAFFDGFC